MWLARSAFAVAAARAVAAASRRTGHSGTALPGLVAERIAPRVAARLAEDLGPVVLISGTNGKTTTGHLLVHILEHDGWEVVANRSGANLTQGVTASLLAESGLDGRLRRPGAVGAFEVDEAALSAVARTIPVSQLVLLNLFRDQLDRYGETDAIVRRWERVCAELPASAGVVSCADDPRLACLVATREGPSLSFGLSEPPDGVADIALTPDVTRCPACDGRLSWGWTGVGHLGDFACESCGFRRRSPGIGVRIVSSRGFDGQTLAFQPDGATRELRVDTMLPGLSNAYNAAAAVAAAISVGIPAARAVDALASAQPAFGRFEEVEMDGRRVVLTLGKNPASLAELARIGIDAAVSSLLFAFNDGFADGEDVSWLWDVDVSRLLEGRSFGISGTRAPDFLLRLKYGSAETLGRLPPGFVGVFERQSAGLDRVVAATAPGGTVQVISTYTALLRIRQELVGRSLLPAYPR